MEEKIKMTETFTPTISVHEQGGLAAYSKVTLKRFHLESKTKNLILIKLVNIEF